MEKKHSQATSAPKCFDREQAHTLALQGTRANFFFSVIGLGNVWPMGPGHIRPVKSFGVPLPRQPQVGCEIPESYSRLIFKLKIFMWSMGDVIKIRIDFGRKESSPTL